MKYSYHSLNLQQRKQCMGSNTLSYPDINQGTFLCWPLKHIKCAHSRGPGRILNERTNQNLINPNTSRCRNKLIVQGLCQSEINNFSSNTISDALHPRISKCSRLSIPSMQSQTSAEYMPAHKQKVFQLPSTCKDLLTR